MSSSADEVWEGAELEGLIFNCCICPQLFTNCFAPILQRLNIPSENWLTIATQFEQHIFAAVGTEAILSNYYQNAGYKRRPKISKAKQLLA